MNKVRLGVDISKETLDFYCDFTQELFSCKNTMKGLEKLLSWNDEHGFSAKDLQIAFEHTGHYGNTLETFCAEHSFEYFQIPALEMKQSLGMIRGKNDQLDAKRICHYLKEKGYKLTPSTPVNRSIQRLKHLQSQRAIFVRNRAGLKNVQIDLVKVMNLPATDSLVVNNKQAIKTFDDLIKKVDEEIEQTIANDKEIKLNYCLITSIVGVGKVIGTETIIATQNFTRFDTWRAYASYCGCAPFPYRSGKYIGRNKISHLANKEAKAHLNSGAKSAIQYDPELKEYFERKLKEGKTKKCITNVIRCKLISRMFSVVSKKRTFEKNYTHSLVGKVS